MVATVLFAGVVQSANEKLYVSTPDSAATPSNVVDVVAGVTVLEPDPLQVPEIVKGFVHPVADPKL